MTEIILWVALDKHWVVRFSVVGYREWQQPWDCFLFFLSTVWLATHGSKSHNNLLFSYLTETKAKNDWEPFCLRSSFANTVMEGSADRKHSYHGTIFLDLLKFRILKIGKFKNWWCMQIITWISQCETIKTCRCIIESSFHHKLSYY